MGIKQLAAAALLCLATPAIAADLATIVQNLDADAEIQRSARVVSTNARQVSPHEDPFTDIIPALCSQPEILEGLDKIIVLNSFAFKGVEFWTYDETEDLTGCAKVSEGTAIQMFAVMH